MNEKSRWQYFNESVNRGNTGPGEIFDRRSHWGSLRGLIYWGCATFFLWNLYDWVAGGSGGYNTGKQGWMHVLAVIIGGGSILVTLLAIALRIRYRYVARRYRRQAEQERGQARERLIFEAEKIEARWGRRG